MVLTGGLSLGLAASMTPGYAKAKQAARRIFSLLDRKPPIDAFSQSGKILVGTGSLAAGSSRFTLNRQSPVCILCLSGGS